MQSSSCPRLRPDHWSKKYFLISGPDTQTLQLSHNTNSDTLVHPVMSCPRQRHHTTIGNTCMLIYRQAKLRSKTLVSRSRQIKRPSLRITESSSQSTSVILQLGLPFPAFQTESEDNKLWTGNYTTNQSELYSTTIYLSRQKWWREELLTFPKAPCFSVYSWRTWRICWLVSIFINDNTFPEKSVNLQTYIHPHNDDI